MTKEQLMAMQQVLAQANVAFSGNLRSQSEFDRVSGVILVNMTSVLAQAIQAAIATQEKAEADTKAAEAKKVEPEKPKPETK